jgi:hypothetical protein
MASRKKKVKVDFSPEQIQMEIHEGRDFLQRVKQFKSGLRLNEIAKYVRMFSDSATNESFDVLSLVAFVHGFDVLTWTMAAMLHVPKVFGRFKNMRIECLFLIVNRMCPSKNLKLEEVQELVEFVEEFASDFRVRVGALCRHEEFEQALDKLTREEKWNFYRFIAPPVTECLSCNSSLSVANPPSLCTVHTLDGPKPSTKITLKCRDCSIFYGCCMSNSNGVSSYYPTDNKNIQVNTHNFSLCQNICISLLYVFDVSIS